MDETMKHSIRTDQIVQAKGTTKQVVPRLTDEEKINNNAADCPACGTPMDLDLKRKLNGRKDQYAPIVRRWKCACGMVLTTRGRRENIEP